MRLPVPRESSGKWGGSWCGVDATGRSLNVGRSRLRALGREGETLRDDTTPPCNPERTLWNQVNRTAMTPTATGEAPVLCYVTPNWHHHLCALTTLYICGQVVSLAEAVGASNSRTAKEVPENASWAWMTLLGGTPCIGGRIVVWERMRKPVILCHGVGPSV